MQNQSFIAFSIFHLYISLIKAYELKKKYADIKLTLILTDHFPGNESFIPQIKKLSLFDDVFLINDFQVQKEYSKLPAYQRFFFREKLLTKLYSDFLKQPLINALSNSEINLFIDSTQFTQWLFYRFPGNFYRLYEDGERLYMQPKDGLRHWLKHFILGYPKKFGRDVQIKEIVAQRPEKLPHTIISKAKKFNLYELTETLCGNEKKSIINLFLKNFSLEKIPQGKKMLLITQPLSEDKIVDEEYKVNLYKRIVHEYSTGFRIFIKPHPREVTDYNNLGDVMILPGNFPLEILNYTGNMKFDRGVTLFSSAIKNANFIDEKIFLGIEWDKLVAENFNFKAIK